MQVEAFAAAVAHGRRSEVAVVAVVAGVIEWWLIGIVERCEGVFENGFRRNV